MFEELQFHGKRESFNSKWGFILACIGSAVGMGNLWMFPTRVSLYGGGSFLIPYFIFVALIGSTGVIGGNVPGTRHPLRSNRRVRRCLRDTRQAQTG